MKKIFLPLLALILAACAVAQPAPTATATLTLTPTSTAAPTLTYTPAPTETSTPAPTPPIETVPFNEETYRNLPQLDVEAWEEAAGRALTPKDIIDASKLGDVTPFPSDALVTGFWEGHDPSGAIIMEPYVDVKVGADKLPMTYEAVMLTNAEEMIPDKIHETAKKEGWTADKLIAMIWRVNTPSGELTGIMVTDGEILNGEDGAKNFSQDFLKGTGDKKDGWMMTPMLKMPTDKTKGDVFGSMVARAMAEDDKTIQQKIQEVMAGADFTKEEDLAEVQELFDENWLFMGGTTDKTVKVK